MKALFLDDIDAMNEYMNRVALQTFSYFDTGKQAALAQIEEKQYEAELLANGITRKNIHKYGFAFGGKKVLIGGWNRELFDENSSVG